MEEPLDLVCKQGMLPYRGFVLLVVELLRPPEGKVLVQKADLGHSRSNGAIYIVNREGTGNSRLHSLS